MATYPTLTVASGASVSLVSEFDKKVQETLYANTYTNGMYCDKINFTGIKEVTVANVGTANLQHYNHTTGLFGNNASRYGNVENLTNHLNTYSVNEDVSFTFEVDAIQNQDAVNMFDVNRALQRTLREKVAPYLDLFRLAKWAKSAGLVVKADAAITGENIVPLLRKCRTLQAKNYINQQGVVLMKDSIYEKLANNDKFMYTETFAKEVVSNFGISHVAGFNIKHAPDEIFPDGVAFFITQKDGLIAPQKLKEYRVHHCPPGLNGDLAEFRMRHDAHVLDIRADCVLVCLESTYEGLLTAAVTHTKGAATASIALTGSNTNTKVWLTTDGTDPRVSPTRIEKVVASANGTASFTGLTSNMSTKVGKYVVYDEKADFMYVKGDFVF